MKTGRETKNVKIGRERQRMLKIGRETENVEDMERERHRVLKIEILVHVT